MVNLRNTPNQQNTFAASAALLVLAGIFAAPALAATSSQFNCPIASVATLDLPYQGFNVPAIVEDEAIEKIQFASSDSLLAPRAEAAIRNAFKAGTEVKAKTVSADENDKRTEADATMSTKLPGISDADFARYKKQMYRRDI
jgi:hypothetical protein